jgi:hypothetical protein
MEPFSKFEGVASFFGRDIAGLNVRYVCQSQIGIVSQCPPFSSVRLWLKRGRWRFEVAESSWSIASSSSRGSGCNDFWMSRAEMPLRSKSQRQSRKACGKIQESKSALYITTVDCCWQLFLFWVLSHNHLLPVCRNQRAHGQTDAPCKQLLTFTSRGATAAFLL